jgi:hypothetical protein
MLCRCVNCRSASSCSDLIIPRAHAGSACIVKPLPLCGNAGADTISLQRKLEHAPCATPRGAHVLLCRVRVGTKNEEVKCQPFWIMGCRNWDCFMDRRHCGWVPPLVCAGPGGCNAKGLIRPRKQAPAGWAQSQRSLTQNAGEFSTDTMGDASRRVMPCCRLSRSNFVQPRRAWYLSPCTTQYLQDRALPPSSGQRAQCGRSAGMVQVL